MSEYWNPKILVMEKKYECKKYSWTLAISTIGLLFWTMMALRDFKISIFEMFISLCFFSIEAMLLVVLGFQRKE